MLKPLLRKTLFANRLSLIRDKKAKYETVFDPDEIGKSQCGSFNRVWKYAYKNTIFYDRWKSDNKLPDKISSLDEIDCFPELTKQDLKKSRDVIFGQFKGCRTVSTGGSTGEPTIFPVRNDDYLNIYADAYLGRAWWGVKPLDRMVSLWGHSHLFGSGLKGRINEFRGRFKDKMINSVRLNAYDMRPGTIADYYGVVKKIKPMVISGYTSSIYKLARYIVDYGLEGSIGNQLKVVIPTAETVSESDVTVLRQAFGKPVAIEYGMAETGVIAHSRNQTFDMPIFWDSFICRVGQDNGLKVTTISNRLFPLINYRTEDVVSPSLVHGNNLLSIKRVEGRVQESFTLRSRNGEPLVLSGILIVHIMKSYPNIYSVQGEQLPEGRICVHLVSDKTLNLDDAKAHFVRMLVKDHPDHDDDAILFQQNSETQLSLAGKEKIMRLNS
jgi:phenylacetate-CoA ligase